MNLEQLVAHYLSAELPGKAYSTVEGYKSYLKLHVVPQWGEHSLASIKAVKVEAWLRDLKKANGQPASPATKAKIRNIMSVVFSHAKRHEWASRNPIEDVRTSTKRLRIPEILTATEFQALMTELGPRERLMVAWAGTTGLRRGELIALRWRDIDFDNNQASVLHSVWRNVMGDAKTEASRKPVPLPKFLVDAMKEWRSASLYKSDDDFLFPSIRMNGATPISPDSILKKAIRPALTRLDIKKRIGWHSFRHGLGTMLRQHGADVKVAQEMLRHANPRITLAIYQQAVSEEKRVAQNQVCNTLFDGGFSIGPFRTLEEVTTEETSTINDLDSGVYGGDDGARTRDLCRDRAAL